MEHPTSGGEPESAPAPDSVNDPDPHVAPWAPPPTGLDYTFSAGTAQRDNVRWDRQSSVPVAIVAFLSAIVGSLATFGLLAVAGFFDSGEEVAIPITTTTAVATTIAPSSTTATELPDTLITQAVWQKVSPSIVTVEVGTENGSDINIFGSGSGVALGNGYIATNHHVIVDTEFVQIVLQDGRAYDATLVGSDELTDLAVLSTDAADLVPVEIGTTSDLSIGEMTIAVGNPLGQRGGASMTVGVLSALSRRVEFDDNTALFGMLQTDAPITNGSSGGALVDEDGRLIGITSAIGLSEAGAEGIGYAIPVELMRRITDEIIEVGEAHHPFLGIEGEDFIEEAPDGARMPSGASVRQVTPEDGAAALAGLEAGDAIVAVAGVQVFTMDELVIQLRLHRVGDTIDLVLLRDGSQMTVPVTLGERPEGL